MSSLSGSAIPDTPVMIYFWGPRQRLPLVPPVWRYLIYAVWRYCYCKPQKSILEDVYTRCKYCGSSCILGSIRYSGSILCVALTTICWLALRLHNPLCQLAPHASLTGEVFPRRAKEVPGMQLGLDEAWGAQLRLPYVPGCHIWAPEFPAD
jgi:hypothetical protein